MEQIAWNDFEKIGLYTGTIVKTEDFPEAKKPAYKVWVDFGKLGIKKSSVQITKLYTKEELIGKQVICVLNFPPKQIANFISEILVTGFETGNGVVLATTERKVPDGTKIS
jgi:tRNA-binding protein